MQSVLERLSQEVGVACDATGACREADPRAQRALGLRSGDRLERLAAPGSEAKLASLLQRAAAEPLRECEVCLNRVDPAGAATFTFDTEPLPEGEGGGFALVGRFGSPTQASAIDAYQAAMADLAALHRETTKQKLDLERLNTELAESNRGLMSLHSELDEKNDTLRRSADVKTRLAPT